MMCRFGVRSEEEIPQRASQQFNRCVTAWVRRNTASLGPSRRHHQRRVPEKSSLPTENRLRKPLHTRILTFITNQPARTQLIPWLKFEELARSRGAGLGTLAREPDNGREPSRHALGGVQGSQGHPAPAVGSATCWQREAAGGLVTTTSQREDVFTFRSRARPRPARSSVATTYPATALESLGPMNHKQPWHYHSGENLVIVSQASLKTVCFT